MLDDAIGKQIDDLCEAGNDLVDGDRFDEAIESFRTAAELIPEPKENWEASMWVYTAIGETQFFKEEYSEAVESLQFATICPDGLGNPLVHLRLGQSHFELSNLDKAADEFTRAYMGAGEEIFEDEDPKYLAFLKTRIDT